jgi:hypothetical protein
MNQKQINLAALRFIALHINDAIIECINDRDFPLDSFHANFVDSAAFPELLAQCGMDSDENYANADKISKAIYMILGYEDE